MEKKLKDLLIYLLEVISEASIGVETMDKECDNPIYTPVFQYEPVFELDSEDIEAIESLSKYEPRLQEFLDLVKNGERLD